MRPRPWSGRLGTDRRVAGPGEPSRRHLGEAIRETGDAGGDCCGGTTSPGTTILLDSVEAVGESEYFVRSAQRTPRLRMAPRRSRAGELAEDRGGGVGVVTEVDGGQHPVLERPGLEKRPERRLQRVEM